jgi:hypothetical protein
MSPDFLDIIRALSAAEARFIIVGPFTIPFLGKKTLIQNKRATATPKDLADLDSLEKD